MYQSIYTKAKRGEKSKWETNQTHEVKTYEVTVIKRTTNVPCNNKNIVNYLIVTKKESSRIWIHSRSNLGRIGIVK